MLLSHRPATPDDLDACARHARGERFYDQALRAQRLDFWHGQLSGGSMLSVVVEDRDRPPGQRLCAYWFSVFLTDAFLKDARMADKPGLAGRLHARTLAGASPILRNAAIRRANAGDGLNLLISSFGCTEPLDEQEAVPIWVTTFSSLFSYHAGYQIKEFLIESYGREWALRNIEAGLCLRADYAGHFRSGPDAPPPDEYPTLLGLTRQEAFSEMGNRFFPMFVYVRPRFGFRLREQRLLHRALLGGTNEEIAGSLNLTLSAVKKGWETVYEHVAAVDPLLLGGRSSAAQAEPRRGTEKKDRLLHYLRQHPEELRPYLPFA